MRGLGLLIGLGTLLVLTGCASRPAPAPPSAPTPPPIETTTDRVIPPVVPPPADWRDLPLSAGDWTYAERASGSEARFGPAGAAALILRCDKSAGRLTLARQGGGMAGAMIVRTTGEARNFPAASAILAPSDALLDALAFSRGRFIVEQAGRPPLVLPAWPEAARVVEDCRS
jgi:hypothetical protein